MDLPRQQGQLRDAVSGEGWGAVPARFASSPCRLSGFSPLLQTLEEWSWVVSKVRVLLVFSPIFTNALTHTHLWKRLPDSIGDLGAEQLELQFLKVTSVRHGILLWGPFP